MPRPGTLAAYLSLPSTGEFFHALINTLATLCHQLAASPGAVQAWVTHGQSVVQGCHDDLQHGLTWQAASLADRYDRLQETLPAVEELALELARREHVHLGGSWSVDLNTIARASVRPGRRNFARVGPVRPHSIDELPALVEQELRSWQSAGPEHDSNLRFVAAVVWAVHRQQPPLDSHGNHFLAERRELVIPFPDEPPLQPVPPEGPTDPPAAHSLSHLSPRKQHLYFWRTAEERYW
ncbi:hypothetical protein JCM11251_003506 [Rhodosporidiobolus azoricus]